MGLSSNQGSSQVQHANEFSPPTPPTKAQESTEKKLKCPRCDSTTTKFCYYNNYNKSQPRHFCKSCRRYWTEGGTLRNVPVGGARKNKRPKPPTNAAKASTKSFHLETHPQKPKKRLTSLGFGLENEGNTTMISLPDQVISAHDDHELQIPCPSFLDLYGCSNGESSALDASLCSSSLYEQPWTYMESTNSKWVWDDIDKFATFDVSLPWDDTQIN